MSSEAYHEVNLSDETKDIHRAIVSLKEELEAVDWYNQRADVTDDAELRAVLEHNRDEEIEHAGMLLEYLRRKMPQFNEELGTYLFKSAPITEIEEAAAESEEDAPADSGGGHSLGIGRLG